MMEFYKVLEKIMKNKDLTIPEVARLCNLSDSTVRSIFTRKQKTVALNIAFKIADGLCIPLEVLNGKEISEHQEVQKLTQETDNFIRTDSITKSSMLIGEKIKKYRKEKGLTQRELADKIGKGFSTVQKYELNISQPPIDVLNRIADTLDINVSKLFDIENTLNQSAEDEAQRQEMYLKELREDTINKYDSLDPFGQKAANKYINFLAKDEE